MTAPERVVLVANPAAGGAERMDEVLSVAADLGIRVVETTEDDPGFGQVRDAVAEGAAVVVAAGGDGTIRAVAQELAGTGVALAVVPVGTGNLLATALGIPDDPTDALRLAVHGQSRRIDVGEALGDTFAVIAGIGMDAEMMRDADSDLKERVGKLAYVRAAASHLGDELVRAVVRVDGDVVHDGPTSMVLVANLAGVARGVSVAPSAEPDDGLLEVVVVTARGAGAWLAALTQLVRDGNQDRVLRARGTSIEVQLDGAMPWQVDGDERPDVDHWTATVRPSSLDVVVPDAAGDS